MCRATALAANIGTSGYALHYSVPFDYWLLSLQLNDYRYRQTRGPAPSTTTFIAAPATPPN
ncbi:ShlB/FhaC/HecB family hemolysin secretion/activation protein [Massilia eburnea]|uniref:ShlB/FhaC/HecB family hemolysin secretion/activation protein n=1 Tax=Massilia eburnea TaxID=1776165 RepID=UPI003D6B8701